MRFEVSASDEHGPLLQDLYRWLRADDDVAEVALRAVPMAEAMGNADVIEIVLTQAVSIGNFLMAYSTWKAARCRRPARFTFRMETGAVVEVEDASEESLRILAHALTLPISTAGAADPADPRVGLTEGTGV